jgi:hypothetical protein
MTDLITGAVNPRVGMAVCNAGGKLLKVVEMQYRYGRKNGGGDTTPNLQLVGTETGPQLTESASAA